MTDWYKDIDVTPVQIRDYLIENQYLSDNGDGTFKVLRWIAPLARPKIMIVAKDYADYRKCIQERGFERVDCVYAQNLDIIRKHGIKDVVYYGDFCAMPNATQVIRELERLFNQGG